MAKRRTSTLNLHPEFLRKNGRNEFVVLPYEEFVALRERLEGAEDLFALRRAVADDPGGRGLTLVELKERLGLRQTRKRVTSNGRTRK